MKFEIPKVTRFLPLQEYAPEEPALAGVGIQVWVDPPRSVLLAFDQLNRDYSQALDKLATTRPGEPKKSSPTERLMGWLQTLVKRQGDERFQNATDSYRRAMYAWYARLWSQSADAETHWSADELETINNENPSLYAWLCTSSWALIEQHRDDVKKGYRGPSVRSPAAEPLATPS